MRPASLAALIVAGIAAAACTGTRPNTEIRSSVESYSEISAIDGATVAVVPGRDDLEGSLQFKAMAALLEQRLATLGLSVVPAEAGADYLAVFDYAIDDGEAVSRTDTVPRYGFTPFYAPYIYGAHFHRAWHEPRFGVIGYTTRERRWREFGRGASVRLIDQTRSAPDEPMAVYEASVASTGTCGRISAVMPYLLDAMLAEFPKPTSGDAVITLPPGAVNC